MRPNPQETVDLVTFPEEILNGKVQFLCSVSQPTETRFAAKASKNHKTKNIAVVNKSK